MVSIFNIYAPVMILEKKKCWDSLSFLENNIGLENTILVGDLNLTLSAQEKRGRNLVRDPSREWVEDLIQEWDLLDIKPSKGLYTWSNKRTGPSHITARLDMFLL